MNKEFKKWLDSDEGMQAKSTDILHFDSYEKVYLARLEASFNAGGENALARLSKQLRKVLSKRKGEGDPFTLSQVINLVELFKKVKFSEKTK